MTVREIVEKLRVNCLVEVRVNNFKVICVERDNINMVKEELLSKEVDNWGIDNTGRLFSTMNKIFVDVKENEHMTKQQYEQYSVIRAEIAPLKDFLFWCENEKIDAWFTKHKCYLITKAKQILLGAKKGKDDVRKEFEMPKELQEKIVKVVRDYVTEKEKELEKI